MPKLIIIRHAESILNHKGIYSGKIDTPLSYEGVLQAHSMGEQMSDENIDIVFSSSLFRSKETASILMEAFCSKRSNCCPFFTNSITSIPRGFIPIVSDSRLDERSYGILEGVDKKSALEKYGSYTIQTWRRGWDDSPQGGESLKQVCIRVNSFIEEVAVPTLIENKNVLVVCHQNSMRAFAIILNRIKSTEVQHIEFENGEHLQFYYDKHGWKHL